MKRKKKLKIGTVIFALFLIYFFYITIEQQHILEKKEVELSEIESLIKEENKVKVKLNEQLQSVNSDDYIEKTARQKLGFVKEGERVFIDTNK